MEQEPKQETLEEVAEHYSQGWGENDDKKSFIAGAKWQQEQDKKMYNEEEVLAFGKSCFYKGFEKAENDDANCFTAFREEIGSLFEQFNNK